MCRVNAYEDLYSVCASICNIWQTQVLYVVRPVVYSSMVFAHGWVVMGSSPMASRIIISLWGP